MKLSELITQCVEIMAEEGDLTVFGTGERESTFEVEDIAIEKPEPGEYPKKWNMPKVFVRIIT